MKIGILSQKASLYSTARLKEAAKERGHEVRVVDYTRCYMNITSHRPQVLLGGEHYAEIQQLELDGPSVSASIQGTLGHGEDSMTQPIDVRIDLHIKDRSMQGMLRQLGVKLQPDGRTKFQLGGTTGNPAVL